MAPHVPQFVVQQLKKASDNFSKAVPEIKIAIEQQKHTDPENFTLHVQTLATSVVETYEKVASLVSDAEKFLASSGA